MVIRIFYEDFPLEFWVPLGPNKGPYKHTGIFSFTWLAVFRNGNDNLGPGDGSLGAMKKKNICCYYRQIAVSVA